MYIRNEHSRGFKLFNSWIKMNKILKKVRKDPTKYAAPKGRQKCMNKLKENILNEAKTRW